MIKLFKQYRRGKRHLNFLDHVLITDLLCINNFLGNVLITIKLCINNFVGHILMAI